MRSARNVEWRLVVAGTLLLVGCAHGTGESASAPSTRLGAEARLQGMHWIAFEITPAGEVGRVEWIEHAHSDEAIDACVKRVAHGMRLGPAAERTIADAQLYVGGLGGMANDLPSNNQSTPRAKTAR